MSGFSPLPQAMVAEFTPEVIAVLARELFDAARYWTTLGQVDRAIQCHQAAALYLQAAAVNIGTAKPTAKEEQNHAV